MKVLDIYRKDVYVELELSIEEVRDLLSVLESTKAIHAGVESVGRLLAELRKIVETVDGS